MPTDRPSRTEILEAVTSLLDRDVKPHVSGPTGYHLRVAIHLLRVLEREIELGPRLDEVEREGLAALLEDLPEHDRSTASLCARIRDGRIAHDDPRLRAHLRAITLAKLAIDQPKYPSYVEVLERGFGGDR
jgi:hypothetical protein